VPGALGFGLRVARSGGDVEVTWPAHPEAIGGYELVGMSCPDRMACATDPVRGLLDSSAPRLVLPVTALQANLPGEALPGTDRLMFYKVRAFSPCEGLAGPTCNFACADPRACWAGCR